MDNQGGKGRRASRNRKSRGSIHASPSVTSTTASATPTTTSADPSFSMNQQKDRLSPAVSSSSTSTPTSPTQVVRNEISKVETFNSSTKNSTTQESMLSSPFTTMSSEVPSAVSAIVDNNQETVESATVSVNQSAIDEIETEKDEDEKNENKDSPEANPETVTSSQEHKKENCTDDTISTLPSEVKAEVEAIQTQLVPPEIPAKETLGNSTEAKVEGALGKPQQQSLTPGKTLIVSPPKELTRSTSTPLTIDIESSSPSHDNGPLSAGARPQISRSESVSPAIFSYSLHSPVGKPGYIGGVGFSLSEEEAEATRGNLAFARRESAIFAVESAVKRFSKRQWSLLIIFGIVDLLSAITISLQAPFFPQEAEEKGATATEYGFVFGIFEFVVFLTSPIFGKYMNKLGPKTIFNVGLFTTSIAVICFGLLDRINDHTWFITLCFVCRIFEALGCGGFFTATFTIIACEFPESVATTFASLETFFGLGMIVGPTVGAGLYGIGGYSLPFYTIGVSLFVAGVLCSLVMPKIEKITDEDGEEHGGYGIWTIIEVPTIAIAALSIAATSMSLGFVSATLEPHIRHFGLTHFQTGLVFIINGGLYALSAPIWGFICDYFGRPMHIALLGNFFIFIAFLFIGPAAFMPFDTILWVTVIGLVIQGLGFGCCLVSGFIITLRESLKHGLPDNMATYGVASGLWTSMVSLGSCIGPTVSGALYDIVGFREGCYLILASSSIVALIIFLHTCVCNSRRRELESQPLLHSISPVTRKKNVETEPPASSYGSTATAILNFSGESSSVNG